MGSFLVNRDAFKTKQKTKNREFFLKLDHYQLLGVFFPLEMSNTCKHFLNPKIAKK